MALLKDELVRDNVVHFVSDIPAYAYIAYINLTQIFVPSDYPDWERFLLKHGWLILLGVRLLIAFYDLGVRIMDREEYIDDLGRIRRKTMIQVLKQFIKEFIR